MTCSRILKEQGKPYPRTCPECQLGPCKYSQPNIGGHAVKINDELQQPFYMTWDDAVRAMPEAVKKFVQGFVDRNEHVGLLQFGVVEIEVLAREKTTMDTPQEPSPASEFFDLVDGF